MVVEHDEEIIRAADYIIDIGPLADDWEERLFIKVMWISLFRSQQLHCQVFDW